MTTNKHLFSKRATPIDNISELIAWKPCPDDLLITFPLQECSKILCDNQYDIDCSNILPKVIYCHDMAGNYLESDRSLQFTDVFPAFRFFRWHLIDIFIYFSHHFITIPPISWINLAHRQGVKVYGTVIIENDDHPTFREIFVDPSRTQFNLIDLANRLDVVRRHVGFEGWLINFEVNLPSDKVEATRNRILAFLRILKRLGSEVVWYDAVTCSGPLKWQNTYNDENQAFFQAAEDGLFLNYNWNSETLTASQERCTSATESVRVFVGVDCFGRGCPGGGGWGTSTALELILKAVRLQPSRPLSVALFAPGWPFENCDHHQSSSPSAAHQKVAEGDLRFWSSLAPLLDRLRAAPIGQLTAYRPTVPYLPMLVDWRIDATACRPPTEREALLAQGQLLVTNCCTGQGRLLLRTMEEEDGGGNGRNGSCLWSSCMRLQQIIPTCRELSPQPLETELPTCSFDALPVDRADGGPFSRSGTCLLIRPKVGLSSSSDKLKFMELFVFPRGTRVSPRASSCLLAVSPAVVGEGTPAVVRVTLFVDQWRGIEAPESATSISVKGRVLQRTLIDSQLALETGRQPQPPWILLRFSLAACGTEEPLLLHRLGIVWCHSDPFLIGLVELSDPDWLHSF